MSYGLGIDLGTAFTAAAVSRGGPARRVPLGANGDLMPSVLRVLADGSLSAGVAGKETADRPEVPGHRFRQRLGDSTPMLIGERSYTAVDLLAILLAAALDEVVKAMGGPPERVVVTCPAFWGPYRREQFAEVTRRAGLSRDSVTLLSEAEAVVTYARLGTAITGPEPVAVYDAGGGTLDATLVRPSGAGVLGVPESLEWFGGVDLDEEILRHLDASADGAVSLLDPRRPEEAATLRRIREACVRAKEALSTATEVVIDAPPVRAGLSRAQLEEWAWPQLAAGLPALRRVLDSADMRAADLSGVLLTGGTARMPLLGRMLTEDLGRPVLLLAEPQHGAALGAALFASAGEPPGGVTSRPRRWVPFGTGTRS